MALLTPAASTPPSRKAATRLRVVSRTGPWPISWGSRWPRRRASPTTPPAPCMAAMTLAHRSGGRVLLGIGASGPQVVEGCYGQPYPKPLARTREYIEIMRRIIRREEPVAFDGEQYHLPYPGGTGLGKP